MATARSNKLNTFIGGRSKLLTEIADMEKADQDVLRDEVRVVMDGYQKWRLVSCKTKASENLLQDKVLYSYRTPPSRQQESFLDKTDGSGCPRSSSVSSDHSKRSLDSRASARNGNGDKPGSRSSTRKSRDCNSRGSEHNSIKAKSTNHNGDSSRNDTSSHSLRDSYDQLSTYTRSNTLPGKGNSFWRTTFNEAYRGQQKSTPLESGNFHGIKTDNFMKWAESDVYRQRLMKAWSEYEENKKGKEGGIHFETFIKRQLIPEKKPVNDHTEKPVPKKKKAIVKKAPRKERQIREGQEDKVDIPNTTLIEVKPAAPSSSDGFWEFYDKPFS